MDAALKAEWVEALRSGKYVQGRQRLKRVMGGGTTYCCLGVLCEVMGVRIALGQASLSPEQRDLAGLDRLQNDEIETRNDGAQAFHENPQTFAQIADYIEAKL